MAHAPRIFLAVIVWLGLWAIAAAQLQQHYAPPEGPQFETLPSVVGPRFDGLDMEPRPTLAPMPPADQPREVQQAREQNAGRPGIIVEKDGQWTGIYIGNPPPPARVATVQSQSSETIPTPPVPPTIPPAAAPTAPATAPAESKPSTVMIIKPEECPPPKPPWIRSFEFGINGASGNSDLLKLRTAFNAKHEVDQHILTFDITYNYADSNSQETENKALAKERYEWLFKDSPWSLFDEDELEYDRFKSYDLRISDHAGVAYMFFKNEITKFKGRSGAGESWKFGGPDEGGTTELLFGLEFERQLTERQKFTLASEVFPAINSLGDFRSDAKLGYEFLVDPVWNVTLKLGATDRYDSQASGKKPNDVEYFGVLLWKF